MIRGGSDLEDATGRKARSGLSRRPEPIPRVLEAIHQQHRIDLDKMSLQLTIYRQQLIVNGIEPDDRDDQELIRLWRLSRDTISAASALIAELGSSRELLDRNLIPDTVDIVHDADLAHG